MRTFEDFVNESYSQNINEGYNDGLFQILSVGNINIASGKCKYFNIYETWPDSTAEIYQDTANGKYKLVFTSGKQPIGDIKEGGSRTFKDDQTGRFLFQGVFKTFCSVQDLKQCTAELGIKAAIGYTYK